MTNKSRRQHGNESLYPALVYTLDGEHTIASTHVYVSVETQMWTEDADDVNRS